MLLNRYIIRLGILNVVILASLILMSFLTDLQGIYGGDVKLLIKERIRGPLIMLILFDIAMAVLLYVAKNFQ